jgi:signal transduction histidine kinase
MKNISYFTALILTILFSQSACNDCNCPEPNPPMYDQLELNKMIVETNTTNVSTAFETVFSKNITDSTSRATFSQIFVDSARFYDDKSGYFFIETLVGAWAVAHVNHDLIGTSRINVQDENGKYFIQEIVQTVNNIGYGFVEYYRKNPATQVNERKLSFVTSIPAANWFIGTGFYGEPESIYYTDYEAKQLILEETVNTMARGISGIIKNIYPDETEKLDFCRDFIDHIKFFDDASGYFFINDFNGINIAHGADAGHQGQNDYDLQDTHGAYIIRDMINIAMDSGNGFYEYYWINPSSNKEEKKVTYIRSISGTDYFIGAGYYY